MKNKCVNFTYDSKIQALGQENVIHIFQRCERIRNYTKSHILGSNNGRSSLRIQQAAGSIPASPASVVLSLAKTLHLTYLLVEVRGPGGPGSSLASVRQLAKGSLPTVCECVRE